MLSKISDGEEWKPDTNFHPTCKPVSLMRWLVRLVTPPGGTVLDPFCGSGSTGIAAVLEGFDFIGVEESAEYVGIARRRIAHAEQHGENWLKGAKAAYGGPRRYGGGKDMGDTVRRCPEHGESFPSGSNSYRCGCPVVRVPDPIATEASDPTLDYGPLFAAIEPTR